MLPETTNKNRRKLLRGWS